MFKRPNTPSFKPMPLRPPRKVVVNNQVASFKPMPIRHPRKVVANKTPGSSNQLKKAAEQARDSLETAIASMNAVCALENREEVPPQYMQEFQRRITCLGDDIRVQWNCAIAICNYMEAAPLKMESRSPSPLLDLLHTSDTDSLSPPRTPTACLPYRESDSVEF